MVAVVCTVIFTITLGNNTVREAPVAVVDLDNSKYSHELDGNHQRFAVHAGKSSVQHAGRYQDPVLQ